MAGNARNALCQRRHSRCLSHSIGNGFRSCAEPSRRPAVEDPLDDVGRKEREAQHAADVGAADPLGVRQLGERAELTLLLVGTRIQLRC